MNESDRTQHMRREIAAIRELCERRAWTEPALRERNTALIASVPGLLSMLEEVLAGLGEVASARDELAEIARYMDTFVPKFPAVGGPTQTQLRIAALSKVGK